MMWFNKGEGKRNGEKKEREKKKGLCQIAAVFNCNCKVIHAVKCFQNPHPLKFYYFCPLNEKYFLSSTTPTKTYTAKEIKLFNKTRAIN